MNLRLLFLLMLLTSSFAVSAEPPLSRINSDLPEYGLVKGPDGWYFSRSTEEFGKPGKEQIMWLANEKSWPQSPDWTDTHYSEGDPYFSADGKTLCFATDRPDPADPHSGDTDIWCANRKDESWDTPQRLPEPVNSPGIEFSPVLAADGSLYFASDREGGMGMGDLYQARKLNDGNWQVENLGPQVNSPTGEWNLDLSPNGELLVFEASHRESNLSIPGDLYLSRKTPSGWSPSIPLSRLNTSGSELMPRFLSNTEMTYASSANGDTQILLTQLDDFLPVEAVQPSE